MGTDFVFAVDLDGYTLDFNEHMAKVVAADLGVDPLDLPDPSDWDYTNWGITRDDFPRYIKQFVDARRYAHLRAYPGASEALWRLSDAGVYIRILTHRLTVPGSHRNIVHDTVLSLEANSIPYRDLCFMGAKSDLGADIYGDDAPHNIKALKAADQEVIIFDQSYNQGIEGTRAKDWGEVEAIVMDRFTEWQERLKFVKHPTVG